MAEWDWVEVVGPTVETAVQAAVEDLGLDTPDAAEVEVIQEPTSGFLGFGGTDAIVRVRPKQKKKSGGRRGRGRGKRGKSDGRQKQTQSGDKQQRNDGRKQRGSGNRQGGNGDKQRSKGDKQQQQRGGRDKQRPDRGPRPEKRRQRKEDQMEVEIDRGAQAEIVKEFLTGLLGAFGLEGKVECTVEDDTIIADVSGEQTEALVGAKGSILQATHELCRTIVQRKSQAGARLRLDIAGYQERRREALRIYTGRLVAKVMEEGGEIMLEPMNPAERKVVHDAAADLGGVRTYSEGEEPNRSVVIAKEE